MDTHAKLLHALVEYDRRESRKKFYNHYALAQYMGRLHDIDRDMAAGAEPRAAIVAAFCGRLLDACLKAIGEPKHTDAEARSKSLCYRPVCAAEGGDDE